MWIFDLKSNIWKEIKVEGENTPEVKKGGLYLWEGILLKGVKI